MNAHLSRYYLVVFKIFMCVFILFFTFKLSAQAVYYEKYGTSEGLPSSQFYDLIEDKNGYLWFTSDRGIVRYDYYEFENFGIADGLSDMVNFTFYQDSDSTFWLNGYDGSFTHWNGKSFEPFEHNAKLKEFKKSSDDWYDINKIDSNFIWFVVADKPLLVQFKINRSNGEIQSKEVDALTYSDQCSNKTIRLISFYNSTKGLPEHLKMPRFFNYTFLPSKSQKIGRSRKDYRVISEMLVDGDLWITTDKGIEIRSLEFPQKRLKNYDLDAAISNAIVMSNNEVWATSISDGIIRIPNRNVTLSFLL